MPPRLPAPSLAKAPGDLNHAGPAHPLERAREAAVLAASFMTTEQPTGLKQIMMRPFIILAAVSFSSAPARAEKMVVDMSKLTCGELTKLGFQDFAGVTMWLSGYYNASVRSTTIDLDQFAQAAKTVKDYCASTPRATVMSAAERALGIKMPRPR